MTDRICSSIVAISFAASDPDEDPDVAELNVKSLVNDKAFPDPSVKTSVNTIPVRGTFPVFLTVMV